MTKTTCGGGPRQTSRLKKTSLQRQDQRNLTHLCGYVGFLEKQMVYQKPRNQQIHPIAD